MGKRVIFYASVSDKELFRITGFYSTDINILGDLGYEVTLSNSFKDFIMFWKYDMSFIYFWTRGVVPAFISKIFGKKVVFTGGIDGLDQKYNTDYYDYTVRKWFFKLSTVLSDANIIVSPTDLENIQRTNIKYSNITLIPHVINFERYQYDVSKVQKENIITTIVWMETKENVIRKGVDKLLYSYKELLKYDDTFKLIIIGSEGVGTEYLKNLAKEIDVFDKVIFTGRIEESEKIDYLKRSKFYFQLSMYEGFGIAAIEALAAGNLVVHSGKGGLGYTIGSKGIQVEDTSDYKSIGLLLTEINKNYSNYSDFIQEGISHIQYNFSYDSRKKNIRNVLERIQRN